MKRILFASIALMLVSAGSACAQVHGAPVTPGPPGLSTTPMPNAPGRPINSPPNAPGMPITPPPGPPGPPGLPADSSTTNGSSTNVPSGT